MEYVNICDLIFLHRLQSSTPVTYCEIDMGKKEKSVKEWREEGSRPEVYTEEHDKLLGSTEMSWTLFVDGYGNDGKRIYDPINGKTCHQCRLPTLSFHCCLFIHYFLYHNFLTTVMICCCTSYYYSVFAPHTTFGKKNSYNFF